MMPDDSSSWVMKFGLLGVEPSKNFGLWAATWMNSRVSIAYSQTFEMRALLPGSSSMRMRPRRSMVTLSSILWPSSPRSRISIVPPRSGSSMSSKRRRQSRQLLASLAVVTK